MEKRILRFSSTEISCMGPNSAKPLEPGQKAISFIVKLTDNISTETVGAFVTCSAYNKGRCARARGFSCAYPTVYTPPELQKAVNDMTALVANEPDSIK